jgi:hypothetical protein
VVAVAAAACHKTSGTAAAKEDLALVPKETNVVFMANIARVRGTAMWKKLLDVRDSDPQSKKDFDEFVQSCGLDPFKQIDSAFVALPQGGGGDREFSAVVRGQFNEQKLYDCARESAKKEGHEIVVSEYAGKKLYSDTGRGGAFAAFLDKATLVIGGQEWIKKTIDLAANKPGSESAKKNDTIVALMKRARTQDALWGVGLVPDAAREQLKNDPRLQSAATMKDVFGSVDFSSGLAAEVSVDTGSEADAKDLAGKTTDQMNEMRKNAQFMLMGMGQYLDGIKIENKGATFHLKLSYNQQQVDDLITRIKGLLRSFGGAMNGAGGGMQGMPLPPGGTQGMPLPPGGTP